MTGMDTTGHDLDEGAVYPGALNGSRTTVYY